MFFKGIGLCFDFASSIVVFESRRVAEEAGDVFMGFLG